MGKLVSLLFFYGGGFGIIDMPLNKVTKPYPYFYFLTTICLENIENFCEMNYEECSESIETEL